MEYCFSTYGKGSSESWTHRNGLSDEGHVDPLSGRREAFLRSAGTDKPLSGPPRASLRSSVVLREASFATAQTQRVPTPAAPRQRNADRAKTAVVLEVASTADVADNLDDDVVIRARLSAGASVEVVRHTVTTHRPRRVLCTAPLEAIDSAVLTCCYALHVDMFVLARPVYGALGPTPIKRFGGLPWLRVGPGHGRFSYDRMKRSLDLLFVALSLPLTVPVMIVIAILGSFGGNPFYFQERVGRGGQTFRMVKFRTMVPHAERDIGPTLAVTNDLRVTPVGRVLRRYRLDELPQLWNVIRGQMSLVGPRPERPEFVTELRNLPNYELRELMQPGLTGIAQLTCGYEASAQEKMRCDLLYLARRSFRSDVTLLALTVLEFGRGFPRG